MTWVSVNKKGTVVSLSQSSPTAHKTSYETTAAFTTLYAAIRFHNHTPYIV